MSKESNQSIRKSNYDYGILEGSSVSCAQELEYFKGLRVADVSSNENGKEVIVYLKRDDDKLHYALYLNDSVLSEENIKCLDLNTVDRIELKQVTETDLQEIANMELYTSNEISCSDGKVVGYHYTYCNSKDLEGQDDFVIKGLYVYYDGKIMTEK
jgi:hypothetical protein